MPVIQSHDITLYGDSGTYDIVLRPLADDHLPLLYRWMSDPEVTYYTESAVGLRYDEDTVRRKYGGMSRGAMCFLVEADGMPVGECWLQPMNRADVRAMYPEGMDVRRIDMCIGEKEYWNKGIGSAFVRMLIDYAFEGEHVDVLHCFCEDINPRSERMWKKNGFALVKTESEAYNPKWRSPIGKFQHHYALTRRAYVERRRKAPPRETFSLSLASLQPSQHCVSAGKLRLCREWFAEGHEIDPIPVRRLMDRWLMLDGHSRAVLALEAGLTELSCFVDAGAWDMAAYAEDLDACLSEGVRSALDLAGRVVSPRDYEVLRRKHCMEKYEKPPYIYLKQGDEVIFWAEKPAPEDARDIRAVGRNELDLFNHHLALCGQGPAAEIDADYFFLLADGEPVARAGIEKIGAMLWELSDVRVAKPWRGKGYGRAVSAHVLNRILAAGRIATCRTMPDNAGMNAILKCLGFAPLYEGENER